MIIIKQTVYLDVLICINIFINYFLLLAVKKLGKLEAHRLRIILGSVFGALTSVIILLPPLEAVINFFIKLIIAIIIILISFGWNSRRVFIKNVILFYTVTFLFCGAMIGIWLIFSPTGMVINNGSVYFYIPPIIIVLSALISYIVVWIINRVISISMPKKVFCKLKICNMGKSCELMAKIDTGNSLKEPFSGCPVIAAEYNSVCSTVPDDIKKYILGNSEYSEKGFRLVPFFTVNSSGILPAFKADEVYINGIKTAKEIYIGVFTQEKLYEGFKALVGLECIE